MKKIVRMITAIVAGVAMVAAVSACGSSDSSKQSSGNASGDKVITVVASTNVWGSLAKELGGKYVDVTSILSSTGVDAHDYEPTTSDIAKFENAQVAIVNGAGYDAWASKATSNKQIVIDAAQEGGKKTGDNPHVWFSSKVRVSTADAITAAYEKLMPEHKAEFQKLNEQWQAKEQDLEQEMKEVAKDDKHLSYAATESLNFSTLLAMSDDFFGDTQHVLRVGRQAVAVVDAVADEPYDLAARQQYELPLFFGHRDLGVDQKIAHFLAPRHAERHEGVAFAPAAQREREL